MTSAGAIDGWVLPVAVAIDLLMGDPRWLPHPIRWMGTAIAALEPRFRRLPLHLVLSGTLFATALIAGTWALTWAVVSAAHAIHPYLAAGVQVIFVYYAVSARSLESAALAVRRALDAGRLDDARRSVGMIVGRETRSLSSRGVTRAAVETVAENLVDGVVSPLFYAALGGAPMAMAYKMVNTLDSMVGYRNDAYRLFGKAAARIDDAANFLPARLAVPCIAMAAQALAGTGGRTFKTAWREGGHHVSPNAGYAEAAFAGALAVKLIGPAVYHGRRVEKPYIGQAFGGTRPADIDRACDLMLLSTLLWTAAATVMRVMVW
jgi:adenosylcobinamide-phosphate synthase